MLPIPLCISGLGFRYGGRQALDNVSFQVAHGESVILLGPNGAGKSTLFSIISGLFAPQQGTVSILGKTLQTQGASALSSLGIVFQAQTLDLDLTVGQNLRYFCSLHGIARRLANHRIEAALERLDLADRINEKVRSLNGGHRRRVEVARATLHEPAVLLLDEPTVGLDIPTRRELIRYLHQLSARDGTALLWATHLVDEVAPSDRVLVLHQGRIVADGRPEALLSQTVTSSLEQAFDVLTTQTSTHQSTTTSKLEP